MNKPHLEITTRIGCKINCKFCPQKKLVSNYKDSVYTLSFYDFKRYLEKIPKNVRIHFSGMSEPFLNDECIKMIKYAYEKGYKISIFTTLIGMDINIYNQLLECEFDLFCVHVADNQGHTNIQVDEKYIELLQCVDLCRPRASRFWYQCHGTPHEKIKHLIQSVDRYMLNRAGNVEVDCFEDVSIEGEFTCTAGDLNQNVLLPNGDIILCCMDYGLEHFLGNLNECEYQELNKSKIYSAMQGKSKALCNKCNRAKEV